ncbi:MFS transporter [Kocuria palustris]|uniref:MFS transporter n=1 Tax=Kocuria palustris TaxID=71999 RepID=UPI001642E042|nr:MFS transporter [Kocuria palustris]
MSTASGSSTRVPGERGPQPAGQTTAAGVPAVVPAGLWSLLWALYTTQFIGASFLSTGLTGILRDGGAALSTLGTLQLLGLIWPLKVLWAPLLDRWSPSPSAGHHRAWALLLQSLMVATLLCLALIGDPVAQLGPVILLAGLFVLFSATQDIAADALSVRELPDAQHDRGAAVQVAASYVGTVIGGGAALAVHDLWGWRAAVGLLAVCTAAAMIPVLRHREAPRAGAAAARPRWADLVGVLAAPKARLWAFAALPLATGGSAALWSLVTPVLTDAQWSLARIGLVTSVVAAVPALAAGLAAGAALPRWGRAPVMAVGAGMQALGGVLLLPMAAAAAGPEAADATGPEGICAVAGACLLLAGYTVLNTGMYAVNLDLCRTGHAGTDFTLLSCLAMLAGTIGAWAGLSAAAATGYLVAILLGLAVTAAGIVVVQRHQRATGRLPV